jgi:putative membrane-bound dehydrogenase-like protein
MSSRILAALVVTLAIAVAIFLVALGPPPSASRGLASLHVPPGFRIEQVTTPGLVAYPMMGTLDDQGRLFLCESSGNTLNTSQMAAKPDYRIRLLEDRDGDGVFDHSSVLADHLTLPAGAVWYRNALYVASPPDVLRIDGATGQRETVVTGWTLSANAASLHGPFFGPDGWLYLTDGRHGFDIKTKDNRHYKGLASRIWRVRPDGTGLESFAGGGFDNPVELVFTPAGETIGTMTYFRDPENGERDALLHFVEGGVYPKWYSVVSEFKRTGDLMPVMTKFARIAPSGLARYRGHAFGTEYEGNLFSAQFNPHRVQRHIVSREGATFRTDDQDFLTSSDPDFHPTDVMEDADGSLLVVDTGAWFINGCPISRVAKPEIRGAVYRIRKVGAPLIEDPRGAKLKMSGAAPAALAPLLADQRFAVRDRAVELLVEAGDAAVGALDTIRGGSRDAEARAAAVFALFRVGTPNARAAVRAALSDPDFEVRTAAARCVGMTQDREALARLMEIVKKDHPAARRQAAAALGQIGDSKAAPILLEAAASAEDRFVEHSIIYSLITLRQSAPLVDALRRPDARVRKAALIALDQMDGFSLRPEQAVAFTGAEEKEVRDAALFVVSHHPDWAGGVLRQLEARIRDRNFRGAEAEPVRDALLAFLGDPATQKLIAGLLRDASLGEEQNLFVLDTIDAGSLKQLPVDWVRVLGDLLGARNQNVQLRAVELIRSHGISGLEPELMKIAGDQSSTDQVRVAAITVLTPKLNGEQYRFLMSKLDPKTDAILRQSAAQALARSAPGKNDLLLLSNKYLPQADPLTLSTVLACFRTSMDPEVGFALVELLSRSPAALGTLGEDRLKALFAGYPADVRGRSQSLLGTLRAAQAGRVERLHSLEPLLTAGGDTGRGRHLFFGDKVACFSCHTIGREGGHVGPDLTGIGAIRSGYDLLEAIVYPSASFVPGHEVYNVDTQTERLAGVIRSRSADAIVLVTGPNGEVRIPRSNIKQIERSNVSLMPEGFDQTLSKTEFTDLLAFLQAEKTRPAEGKRQ